MKLKLKFVALVFRAWYYFRLGYSTYLSFLVSFVMFVSTTYYLAVSNMPFLQEVFPHFYTFIIVGISVITPLSVLIGWFHMKRTLAYPTEQAITVESNPYNYKIMPGVQTEISWPLWTVVLATLQKFLEKENILSPEEKREFENVRAKIQRLREGKVVGKPRQRQVLAALKREHS